MLAITLQNVGVGVTHNQGGAHKTLVFIDQQSGIQVVIPFDKDGWAKFEGQLHGVIVASNGEVPKEQGHLPFEHLKKRPL